MSFDNELIIWYLKGNNEDGELGKVIGYVIDESTFLYTILEVKRKVILSKRSIIKIERIERPLKRNPEFLDI